MVFQSTRSPVLTVACSTCCSSEAVCGRHRLHGHTQALTHVHTNIHTYIHLPSTCTYMHILKELSYVCTHADTWVVLPELKWHSLIPSKHV